MSEQQSSYRQIMKGTSVFGGVQVFNILIGILKSKIIAILLGPAGMGITGLLTSTTSLISGLTNFGLGISGVRDISEANSNANTKEISKIIIVVRRLIWITGILGAIVLLISSPLLSKITFGNQKYTLAFIWLSITLLFDQITSGERVLLQGMRKIKYLAKANIWGSFLGLIVSVPIYYFFRTDGIVPALIFSSLISMLIAWQFSKKIKIESTIVSKIETLSKGKSMLSLGFMLSLSGLVTLAVSYIIRIYINHVGNIEDVGMYSAGFTIIGSYTGMVFTAMSTDYYPRLAGLSHDNKRANQLIEQQAEIALLILGPILCVFIIFSQWAVILLYSEEFLLINKMILWAALGMYFKAVSWAIAFIFLAKGESKTYFWNDTFANSYVLLLNIIGYKIYGLTGLGISFFIAYFLYFLQAYIITKKRYKFSYSRSLYLLIIIQFLFGLLCYFIIRFLPLLLAYTLGILVILTVSLYSYHELDKRLRLKLIINDLKDGKRK